MSEGQYCIEYLNMHCSLCNIWKRHFFEAMAWAIPNGQCQQKEPKQIHVWTTRLLKAALNWNHSLTHDYVWTDRETLTSHLQIRQGNTRLNAASGVVWSDKKVMSCRHTRHSVSWNICLAWYFEFKNIVLSSKHWYHPRTHIKYIRMCRERRKLPR